MASSDLPAYSRPAPALRAPAHQVSPRAPVLWALGAVAQAVVVAAVLVGLRLATGTDVPWWCWLLYAGIAVAYAALMPVIRYRVHRWESTETAVYVQTGWLARERRIAPMSRVQTVDLEQNPVGRLLGLATVTVTTASAAGPIAISNLPVGVAEQLVVELTRRADTDPGDAT